MATGSSNLPPILNAPQVGMLIRHGPEATPRFIVELDRIDGLPLIYDPVDDMKACWALRQGDLIKWPNAPEDSWVPVFAEKTEPVREWANLYLMSNGEVRTADWHNSPGDAENYRDNGSRFLAVICRERQPDGTWRAVQDNPLNGWTIDTLNRDVHGNRPYQSRYAGLWEKHPDAKWIGTDEGGYIRKYNSKPVPNSFTWSGASCHQIGRANRHPDWRDSLEPRPEGV